MRDHRAEPPLRPGGRLIAKVAVSAVVAVALAFWTHLLVIHFPAWAVSSGVGLYVLGGLIKAAWEDYERERELRSLGPVTSAGDGAR